MTKRKILGILIPLVNVPLFFWNLWQTIMEIKLGMKVNQIEFFENLLLLITTLGLSFFIPRMFPVYKTEYFLGKNSIKLSRFLRGDVKIDIKEVERVELFMRLDKEISEDAEKYAMDSSANLRKAGFKFKDYTNAEDIILNLFSGEKIYMISPEKPKTMIKELKKRNKKLSAKIVELHRRGKRIQELGAK
jgi:hypothetical protein